jgi:hypothetical protein
MLVCTSWFADYALNMAVKEENSKDPEGCGDIRKRPYFPFGYGLGRAYRAAVRTVEAEYPRGALNVHSGRLRRVHREGAIKRMESDLTMSRGGGKKGRRNPMAFEKLFW